MENVEQVVTEKKSKPAKEERLEQLKGFLEAEKARHAEKVRYYEDLIAKWEAKGDKMSGVNFREGDVVAFTHGRPGHVQTEKEGTVIGFKDTGKAGVFAVIECGEGVDKEIVRVRPSAVSSIVSAMADSESTDEDFTEAPHTIVL